MKRRRSAWKKLGAWTSPKTSGNAFSGWPINGWSWPTHWSLWIAGRSRHPVRTMRQRYIRNVFGLLVAVCSPAYEQHSLARPFDVLGLILPSPCQFFQFPLGFVIIGLLRHTLTACSFPAIFFCFDGHERPRRRPPTDRIRNDTLRWFRPQLEKTWLLSL